LIEIILTEILIFLCLPGFAHGRLIKESGIHGIR
jgi:hypothetical protein